MSTTTLPDNVIPPMTDPLSRSWSQPRLEEILIDDTHALMSDVTFKKLSEYSCTQPSGVYLGKMWRRDRRFHDRTHPEETRHVLAWYGVDKEEPEKFVSNNYRIILIIKLPRCTNCTRIEAQCKCGPGEFIPAPDSP